MPALKKRKLEGSDVDQHQYTKPAVAKATAPQSETTRTPIPPTFLNIFDSGSGYPAFKNLCQHLPIADIISLSRTCKKFSDLYQYLLPMEWNINHKLRHYVKNPLGFRSMMARCNVLIFGFSATQFFERSSGRSAVLSCMVEKGEDYEIFSAYLYQVEADGGSCVPEVKVSLSLHDYLTLMTDSELRRTTKK